MSAITGIVNVDGAPVDLRVLRLMGGAGARPGAAATSTWHAASVGFVWSGVAVKESAARPEQPVIDTVTGVVVLLDGHLHAQDALRESLTRSGLQLESSASEADLVVKAYEVWGELFAHHLLGEYVLVVWDPKRRKLICARDSAGVRPLFYHQTPSGSLRFATTACQLLVDPDLPRKGDQLGILDFLVARGSFDPHRTPFLAIKRLPAAHTLTLDASGMRVLRHWSIDDEPELAVPSGEEYTDAFAEAICAAIRDRVGGESLAGISLSGGYDSGALFVLWQWMRSCGASLPPPWWHTFYWDDPEGDERDAVANLVRRWPAEGGCMAATPEGLLDGLEAHTLEQGLPEAAFGWRCLRRQAIEAREAKVHLLLTGEAGNHVTEHSALRAADLLVAKRPIAAGKQLLIVAEELGLPAHACLWPFVIRPAAASLWPRLWGFAKGIRRALVGPRALLGYLTPRMQRALESLQPRSDPNLPGRRGGIASADKHRRLERLCRETFPLPFSTELEGVRLSAPYLDRRVVRIAQAALQTEKRPTRSRRLLVHVLERTAAERLEGTKGHGTRTMCLNLMRTIQQRRQSFREMRLAELGIVEAKAVEELADRFALNQSADSYWLNLWLLLSLETWAQCVDIASVA